MHDQGITHRDLKPENILLVSNETNESLLKITDFGLSRFFDSTSVMKTFCGTPNYLAPEVLKTRGQGAYTNKIDNWSLGVILYICLVGFPPFSDEKSVQSMEQQIIKGAYSFPQEYWSHISKDAIDLIKKLMCVDPLNRISLDQVLEHDWLKNSPEIIKRAQEMMLNESKKRQNTSINEESNCKKLKTSD